MMNFKFINIIFLAVNNYINSMKRPIESYNTSINAFKVVIYPYNPFVNILIYMIYLKIPYVANNLVYISITKNIYMSFSIFYIIYKNSCVGTNLFNVFLHTLSIHYHIKRNKTGVEDSNKCNVT